jgi:hypothetical protein
VTLRKEAVPAWREPTLATLTEKRFSDPGWIFERKFDGERCLAFRDANRVRLSSRNRQSLDATYPELVDALAAQHMSRFVVDGEIVAFEGRRTSFARLQGRLGFTDAEQARASGIGATGWRPWTRARRGTRRRSPAGWCMSRGRTGCGRSWWRYTGLRTDKSAEDVVKETR